MIETINNFRKENGVGPVEIDSRQNEWCTSHCWEMARQGTIFHAIPEFIGDWGEIVASCPSYNDWWRVERDLIESIDSSWRHRDILLKSKTIGYGVISYHWWVYLTIRGK